MAAHRQDGDRAMADARLREAQALLPCYYVAHLSDALAAIVSDLDVHGEDHPSLYGDGALPIEYFAQRLATVEQRISEVRASGTVSCVFEEFIRNARL